MTDKPEALGPETLDALADELGNKSEGSLALTLEAHAAAWEADRRRLEALEQDVQRLDAMCGDALSDLEFVERTAPGSNFRASILKLRNRWAVLAAGEETT